MGIDHDTVVFTEKAIYEYLAFELLVPDTASRQSERTMRAVRTLDYMPKRYKVYEEEPWKPEDTCRFMENAFRGESERHPEQTLANSCR